MLSFWVDSEHGQREGRIGRHGSAAMLDRRVERRVGALIGDAEGEQRQKRHGCTQDEYGKCITPHVL